jgi:hypothetical protein
LNSEKENFFDELTKLAKELRAVVCLEAIAGKITG